ncbi:G-protein coupled receptor Mth2-like isoform X2 [Vespa velutina]|uniref:G-protein coupled receptor Mth2-like isoform X2 n=1 Tax=Vespa velutina TaxID=202808 RepID=UPI001FB2361B|nr:G-protein coupled receptor Mth2-like isoform X2 [Vespa velutina]XP_047369508.1 G-protein coupled receptor Mth2-like isoform X2 [Vespa velutina]
MPSNMNYKRKPCLLSMKVPVWILCLHWLIWTSLLSEAIDINCCQNDTTWVAGRNCSDGSNIRIKCTLGFYKINGELEEFNITETKNGAILTETESLISISQDHFCVIHTKNVKPSVLVCFDETYMDEPPLWKSILFFILSMISAIFLIATLMIYLILPELREIQDKAMMGAVFSLAVSYIILCVQHIKEYESEEITMCVALAFFLYYAFMTAFFWLNIVAFNIWRTVWFKNFLIKDRVLFFIYCVYGWFVPICFLISALIAHHIQGSHLKPHFGEYRCWFNGTSEVWVFFYGPIAFLLTLNVIYLGLTSWRLWHEYREYIGNNLRALRFKCLLYIKLMLVMGITWIFEILSFAAGTTQWYWIPTDILNTLQGFIIFLLLVVTRKRVRKLLAKKKPCGIIFPKSWTAYEDEECEIVLPEELELSQQD